MNKFAMAVLFVFALVEFPCVYAEEGSKERLVLMPLRLAESDRSLQGAMESALVNGLQQQYEVFFGERVQQEAKKVFAQESATAKKECDETRCMENIALAFQAELIATATITQQDGGYFLVISIRNIFDSKVVRSESVTCKACDKFEVVEKLKKLVAPPENKNTVTQNAVDSANSALCWKGIDKPTLFIKVAANKNYPASRSDLEAALANALPGFEVRRSLDLLEYAQAAGISTTSWSETRENTLSVIKKIQDDASLDFPKIDILVTLNPGMTVYSDQDHNSMATSLVVELWDVNANMLIASSLKYDSLKEDIETACTARCLDQMTFALMEKGPVSSLGNYLVKDLRCKNIIEPEMVNIPGGSFQMIDMMSENQNSHTVTIKPFNMAKTETTWEQYQPCVDAGVCTNPLSEWGNKELEKDKRPVRNVSWDHVKIFIKWLNQKTGKKYRLPSESEWEYAARAGSTAAYSFGDEMDCSQARYGKNEECVFGEVDTQEVASYPANAFGLFDMHGNISEWTQDCFHKTYEGAPTDGSAWLDGGYSCMRMNRGGNYADHSSELFVFSRNAADQSRESASTGFRLAYD